MRLAQFEGILRTGPQGGKKSYMLMRPR